MPDVSTDQIQAVRILFLTVGPPEKLDTVNRDLYASLRRRGAVVEAIPFRDPQCLSESFLSSFSHVTFLACDGYNLHINSFTSFIDSALLPLHVKHPHIRIVNPIPLTLWNTNKTYLLDLQAAGFLVPPTRFLEASSLSILDLKHTLSALPSSSPVVLKPSISASAFSTHLLLNPHNLSASDEAVLSKIVATLSSGQHGALMLQDYVPEIVEHGEYSLVFIAGRCTHAVRKMAAKGEFRVNSAFGGRRIVMKATEAPKAALTTGERMWQWLEQKFRFSESGKEMVYMRLDGALRGESEFVICEVELIEPYMWLVEKEPNKTGLEAFCDAMTKGRFD